MDIVQPDLIKSGILELLVVSAHGLGKRTPVDEYKVQGRGGSGIKTMNITDKTGLIVGTKVVNKTEEQDLMLISKKGQVVRTPLKSVPSLGRATQGVRIMRFKTDGDVVVNFALL